MSATLHQLPNDAIRDVRPGDQDAATQVERWLQDYAVNGDPQLREQVRPTWAWPTGWPCGSTTAAEPPSRTSSRPHGPG